jgi:hypothetical protein
MQPFSFLCRFSADILSIRGFNGDESPEDGGIVILRTHQPTRCHPEQHNVDVFVSVRFL